jgi:D-glycero-alpha-D-manno-heptose-7-phosphate kinase
VILPRERQAELHRHLMLCFTGLSRYSSEVAKSTIDNLAARESELTRMAQMVEEAIRILATPSTPIAEFGRLLDEAWQHKRRLSDKVSTSQVDEFYETARSAGAIGGKLMGAGGGGFMLLFVPPELQPKVRSRLAKLVHVPFELESDGSRVVLYQPNGL